MKHLRMPAVPAAATAIAALCATFSITGPAAATETKVAGSTSRPGAGAMAWTPVLLPFNGNKERADGYLTTTERNRRLNNCRSGYLCIAVGEGNGRHTVYELYYCGERQLTNFIGIGAVTNNQVGNATARLLDRNKVEEVSIPADNRPRRVDWNPIWYIDPC